MKAVKSTGIWAAVMMGVALPGVASAELIGLLNGRSADVSRSPDLSVEAGAVFGEIEDIDYQHLGGRLNYKLNPQAVVYADIGTTELDSDTDGLGYGVGVFYQMDGVFTSTDFGFHGSVHLSDLENDFNDELNFTFITAEAVFSGKEPINASGSMFWNASLGINRRSGEGDSESELALGGGITLRTASGSGEFYAGILNIDDLFYGAGYRHFLD